MERFKVSLIFIAVFLSLFVFTAVASEEVEGFVNIWNWGVVRPSIPAGYRLYVDRFINPYPLIEITFFEGRNAFEGKVWITGRVLPDTESKKEYEKWLATYSVFINEYSNGNGVKFRKYISKFNSQFGAKFVIFIAINGEYIIGISSQGGWVGDEVFTPSFLEVIVDGFNWKLDNRRYSGS